MGSTYAEHVFYIRQGQYHDPLQNRPGLEAVPFYLFSDFFGSVAKLPLSVAQMWKNDYEGSALCPKERDYSSYCGDDPASAARYLNGKYQQAGWNIHLPAAPQPLLEQLQDFALATPQWLVTQPTRSVVSPSLVQAGAEAWNNMLRRIDVTFRTDGDFLLPREGYEHSNFNREPTGAMAIFFLELIQFLRQNPAEQWELTLVGHSMGAILLNRVVRRFGENLPIANIVYMAAASTMKDYEETTWPYIRSRRNQQKLRDQQEKRCKEIFTQDLPQTVRDTDKYWQNKFQEKCRLLFPPSAPTPKFYNLMLHPKAEAQEASLYGIVPRGSLLVWLDGFLTNPPTPLDRMLGRFTNFMVAADRTPADIAWYIRPKVFGRGIRDPKNHGAFSACVFWNTKFWKNVPDDSSDFCPADNSGG